MLQRVDIERTVGAAEPHQVQRRQIARRVVEEHVLRARVRGVDASQFRAGVPVVDRRVVLHAGIRGVPGRFGDAVPQRPRAHRPGDLARGAVGELPLPVGLDGLQERVGDAHRVVGVLARDREVGFRLPIRVEGRELDVAIALAGELDDPLDVVLRQLGLPGGDDLAAQPGVRLRVEGAVAFRVAVKAGAHHGVEVPVGEPRAGDERGDLLLLAHLPGDEVFDVGMVDVDRHHLGGAPCRAARLDGARRAIADLEERHQPRRPAAARQRLAFAADLREVGAGAGAILEEARLAHPEVHDAALVHQIVGDALDEAGVRLRPFIGRRGRVGRAVPMVDEPMALARTVDAVGPMQAGVEPLRRIGRADLRRQHVAMLVVEGAGVFLAVEVAALPAPVGPGAGHAMEDLAGSSALRRSAPRVAVRPAPPGRAPNATAIAARRVRRSWSGARPRRRGGNTFARARRPRPATIRPARRRPSIERRSSRRDCGFRNRQHETPFLRMAIFLLAYTDAPSASTIPRAQFPSFVPCAGGVLGRSSTHIWARHDSKLQNLVCATTFCR